MFRLVLTCCLLTIALGDRVRSRSRDERLAILSIRQRLVTIEVQEKVDGPWEVTGTGVMVHSKIAIGCATSTAIQPASREPNSKIRLSDLDNNHFDVIKQAISNTPGSIDVNVAVFVISESFSPSPLKLPEANSVLDASQELVLYATFIPDKNKPETIKTVKPYYLATTTSNTKTSQTLEFSPNVKDFKFNPSSSPGAPVLAKNSNNEVVGILSGYNTNRIRILNLADPNINKFINDQITLEQEELEKEQIQTDEKDITAELQTNEETSSEVKITQKITQEHKNDKNSDKNINENERTENGETEYEKNQTEKAEEASTEVKTADISLKGGKGDLPATGTQKKDEERKRHTTTVKKFVEKTLKTADTVVKEKEFNEDIKEGIKNHTKHKVTNTYKKLPSGFKWPLMT